MIRIMLSGCNGRMGQAIVAAVAGMDTMNIIAGVDTFTEKKNEFPVYSDAMEYGGQADVVIDFSNPSSLSSILSYCITKHTPLVLATTGHTEQQIAEIESATAKVAVFRSANMSLGINLITELAKQTTKLLAGAYDIEIVESHHNQKLDAPSGTALLIADAVKSVFPSGDAEYIYNRQDRREKRGKNEIGIHSIRGGTIVGDHNILFAGNDELIEIRHSALSRSVFANGAIKAAAFMADKTTGLYSMEDIIREIL